ncbi:MAG: hypothetical protein Fur0019_18690 [Tibeticola sp.]
MFDGPMLTALAMLFIAEGMLPLIAPGAWRRMFAQLMQLRDGQLRFFGLCSVALGVMLLVLL